MQAEYAVANARCKALDVWNTIASSSSSSSSSAVVQRLPDFVIACDTIVEAGGQILEKPRNKGDAKRMLRTLSPSHAVHSGVCILSSHDRYMAFSETTTVHFSTLSEETLEAYANTSEPYDKAGSYGIQGIAGSFVTKIDGCYNNVVGLPLQRLCAELRKLVKEEQPEACSTAAAAGPSAESCASSGT
jgi:septum formation protein